MIVKELSPILAFLFLVGISILVNEVTDVSLVWVFLGLGSLGWLALHIYIIRIQKEIDEKNKNIIFDVSPASEIIEEKLFSPPLKAKITVEDKDDQQVTIYQKIVTKENVFIGYRKKNNEEGVCLESQIEYL